MHRRSNNQREKKQKPELCSICMQRKVTASIDCCDHHFCYTCIKAWVKGQAKTCPMCRRDVRQANSLRTQRCLYRVRRQDSEPDSDQGFGSSDYDDSYSNYDSEYSQDYDQYSVHSYHSSQSLYQPDSGQYSQSHQYQQEQFPMRAPARYNPPVRQVVYENVYVRVSQQQKSIPPPPPKQSSQMTEKQQDEQKKKDKDEGYGPWDCLVFILLCYYELFKLIFRMIKFIFIRQ